MGTKRPSKAKILFVEDDKNLNSIIEDILLFKNYDVVSCFDGETAMIYLNNQSFDLLLLDIMMPELDGITLAREIRKKDGFTPIIFLTAKSAKEDVIEGYKSGADDYITKPFDVEELVLRVEAVLKRTKMSDVAIESTIEKVIDIGKYTLDTESLTLSINEVHRKLTKKEMQLLKLLYLKKNEVLNRNLALKVIWGSDDYYMGRSMDVYISKLRKYLIDDPDIQIENVHGIGFKLIL